MPAWVHFNYSDYDGFDNHLIGSYKNTSTNIQTLVFIDKVSDWTHTKSYSFNEASLGGDLGLFAFSVDSPVFWKLNKDGTIVKVTWRAIDGIILSEDLFSISELDSSFTMQNIAIRDWDNSTGPTPLEPWIAISAKKGTE